MIKDLKLISQKLEESELRLSLVLDVAEIGVWEWNVTDNYLFWDSRMFNLFGISPNQFGNTYECFLELLDDASRPLVDKQIHLSLDTENYKYSICYTLKNGNNIRGIGKVTRDASGNPIRMTGVCMNVDLTCVIHSIP